MNSKDTEMPNVDLSQKEKIMKMSFKGKVIVKQAPSSSKDKSSMEHIPRWLRKEVMIRNKRQGYSNKEGGMGELIKALKKPKSPIDDA